MSDCVSSSPLFFSVLQVPKSGLTPLARYPSITSTHCSGFRNCRVNLASTRASRKSRVLGSEESEFRGELGFKEKSQEPLELESRLQNDSTGLDILELKGEKRNRESEEEDFVRARDSNEIEESRHLKAKVRYRRGRQMIRRSNMLAKQVISIQSALSLGFVSQIWVDINSWMVLIVEVRPNLLSGESERFLLEDVEQVGDVVLVENENVLDNELKMVGLETLEIFRTCGLCLTNTSLVGYRVVTPGQQYIGKVRGYSFNINSGAVELLELDSFGISIIPSSLVSTYALPVEDILEVLSDTVIVHEAAASQIQRLTKGIRDAQNLGTSIDEMEEYSDSETSFRSDRESSRRSLRRPKSCTKIREPEDDWELPMDYL